MEELTFDVLGQSNFPDIDIEKIEISASRVIIQGEMSIHNLMGVVPLKRRLHSDYFLS